MTEGLNCTHSIFQVLGCLLRNATLLDEYNLEQEDFSVNPFHEIIFTCIYNLYHSGVNQIDAFSVDTFISRYDTQYKIFLSNKGNDYVNDIAAYSQPENFVYHYQRIKKFSYLRYLEKTGVDTRWIYDSTVVIPDAQEKQMKRFDSLSIDDMIDLVDSKYVNDPRIKYTMKHKGVGQLAGVGLKALKEQLKEVPVFGIPLQSAVLNTVARGARLKTVYLRSSNSGGGKTRLGVADLCSYCIPWYYNLDEKKWIHSGFSEPTLIISTELARDEIQTLIIAYVSGVNEGNILDGRYAEGEEERVDLAITYIESSPFYIEFMPDFDIQTVAMLIKKYKREKGVSYINFDYIHTSVSLIAEIASSSRGLKLREDQILFLLMDKLKNICTELNVHIDTSTQVTGEYKDVKEKDNTILRGAKSLADRVDMGIISLAPSSAELEGIKPILAKQINMPVPNLIQHIYKLRRGKLSKIRLWQYVDLGTCRIKDLFVTDNDYNLIPVEATHIDVEDLIDKCSVKESEIIISKDEEEISTRAIMDW